MLLKSGYSIETKRGDQTGGRREGKVPDPQVYGNADVVFSECGDNRGPAILARYRLRWHIDLDPDRLVAAAFDINREGLARLSCVSVHSRDERIGPFSS